MLGRVGICFLVMTLIFLTSSCTRLSEPTALEEGEIAVEKMTDVDSIPSKWGKLVSVSNRSDWPHVFQLWFQDEDGNVRMASYNMSRSRLLPNAIVIPQK